MKEPVDPALSSTPIYLAPGVALDINLPWQVSFLSVALMHDAPVTIVFDQRFVIAGLGIRPLNAPMRTGKLIVYQGDHEKPIFRCEVRSMMERWDRQVIAPLQPKMQHSDEQYYWNLYNRLAGAIPFAYAAAAKSTLYLQYTEETDKSSAGSQISVELAGLERMHSRSF